MHNTFDDPSIRWVRNLIPAVLILLFFVHSLVSVNRISQTYDEITHHTFGLDLLRGNAERPWESVMPISAWNALPSYISESGILPDGKVNDFFADFLAARIMSIVFACAIACLVFHFARSLYGYIPALVSLFLFIFDPNILAHSQLATTDIFVTGALLFVTFSAWRFIHDRGWKNALLFALSIGFALVTKYTAMSFIPLFFLILVVYDLAYLVKERTYDQIKSYVSMFRQYLLLLVVVAAVSIFILNAAYRFHQTFVPFGDYAFRETIFADLQDNYPFLNSIPVPVPYAHLQGFDWILAFESTGDGHGRHYLLGELRVGEGFPGYYIIAFFLKEPFTIQVLLILAFTAYFMDASRRSNFWQRELFLFFPIAFYSLYFNFFYNSQIGIRYYLVVFPLLHIFAGSLFTAWDSFSWRKKTISILSSVYLMASVFSYFPYYIPYFNEFVWNRTNAYKYLADSNLDWGQGRKELEQYLVDNPDVSYPTRFVRVGTFVVGVNDLVGIKEDPAVYEWLRENFRPAGNVAYSYLIFEITPEEKRELCLNTSYCKGQE
jgi:4-amino-4-deoxy-L-arabinose transferase-like glycosyltransferase